MEVDVETITEAVNGEGEVLARVVAGEINRRRVKDDLFANCDGL